MKRYLFLMLFLLFMLHRSQCVSQTIDGLEVFSWYSRVEAVGILGTPDRIEINGDGMNGLALQLIYGKDVYGLSFDYDEEGNDVLYEELSKGDKGYDADGTILDENGFYHIHLSTDKDTRGFLVVDSKWFDRNKGRFTGFRFQNKGHSINHNGNVMRVGDYVSSLFSMKAELDVIGKVRNFISVGFDDGNDYQIDYYVRCDDEKKIFEISGMYRGRNYLYHPPNHFKRCSAAGWEYVMGYPLDGILTRRAANFILLGPGANTCILVSPERNFYRVTFDSNYCITGIEVAD